METKLDLVLRDFAEKGEKLRDFRKDTILAASMGGGGVVGGVAGGALVRSSLGGALGRSTARAYKNGLSPLETAIAVGVPFTAALGVKAGLAARDLNKAQEYLDSAGGVDNLTDKQVEELFLKINKGTILNPKSYKLYIPSSEYDKFNSQVDEVKSKYPLDKSMKKTPEYKQNKALRKEEINKINIQRARALLKYSRLGKPIKK